MNNTQIANCVGGVLSPVLANLALSVLDEYVAQIPGGTNSTQSQRATRRRRGHANYRLVRYADDWLVLVSGDREHAEQMKQAAAAVLAPMGLRLSTEKTKITHIDEGLDFWGGASSVIANEAQTGTTSTPTRPTRPSRP